MSLEADGLRQRRTGVKRLVEDLDIFEKVTDNVKEEKKLSSGLISIICFSIIFCLVIGELAHYISGNREYEYRFDVDTALYDLPNLDMDMVVATPCNNLAVMSSMDESGGIFAPLQQSIQKDPTRKEQCAQEKYSCYNRCFIFDIGGETPDFDRRLIHPILGYGLCSWMLFEFTDEEQMYWTVLRHAHAAINHGGLRGLEELQYVDSDVEDNLEQLANKKQNDEAVALTEQRKNNKDSDGLGNGQLIFMIGNGMGMFQIVASNGADEGTACRVHGKFPVRKGKEEKITISIGTSLGLGVFAHLLTSISTLWQPRHLSLLHKDCPHKNLSRYIWTIHYGLSILCHVLGKLSPKGQYHRIKHPLQKKKLNEGEHSHGGILFEYEFCANVIEIREAYRSIITLLVRLCAIVGGVFATSRIVNNVIQQILSLLPWATISTTASYVEKTTLLNTETVAR
ncbi:unnamed protein product [Strongylus vulgaris]|uniref:Endoplasmic reticulum vesicle transporter N-terminal domain-containing protein n=1 Tax=Strongylus vulgaris TaxID=40348 RepID=A0A3P7JDK1_STRVU|nr:unnamed protein product [Strongylus vulgaris]